MKNINENKFYQSLENIFTGANIEGESNLETILENESGDSTTIALQKNAGVFDC